MTFRNFIVFIFASLIYLLLFGGLQRVVAQKFSENPEEFFVDYRQRLIRNKSPQNEAMLKRLTNEWQSGYLSVIEQQVAIKQINTLLSKGWSVSPDINEYLHTLLTIRTPGMKGNVSSAQFFDVTDSCIKYYNANQTKQYLKWLQNFAPRGIVFQTGIFNWRLVQQNPQLVFKTDEDRAGGKFPALRFDSTTIAFFTKTDSGSIKQAKGFYNLFTRKFYGIEGRYDWGRVGLPPQDVYCTFDKFELDLTSIDFVIDTVTMHYKNFLPRPLKGYLREHLEPIANKDQSQFPLFKSYEDGLKIHNFVDRVDYEGGITLAGVTKIGTRTQYQPATLKMYAPNNELAIKVQCDEVVLDPKKMVTDNANVTIYISREDSIRHGSMRLLYQTETKDISLSLNRKDVRSQQPLLNSYHKMGMYFDELKWNTGRDTMYFSAIVDREHKLFAIESMDYYNETRFRQYRGVLDYNPIVIIYMYYRDINDPKKTPKKVKKKKKPVIKDEWDEWATPVDSTQLKEPEPEPEPEKKEEPLIISLFIDDILKKYEIQRSKPQFVAALSDLQGFGLIEVSKNKQFITIKDPLIRLGKSMTAELDYDAISIPSLVEEGINARLSCSSKRLDLFGVESFQFSDSQFVEVTPTEQLVQIYKDRDLKFGGMIKVGKINLTASKKESFNFYYQDFKIVSDSITSLTFSPERDPSFQTAQRIERMDEGSKKLSKGLQKLKIQGLSGTIFIDKPYSKSGVKTKAYYSMFDCHTPSFVFWSDKNIQNGIYTPDKFFFVVDPFLIDSLEIFNMNSLEFLGELNCPDILNPLRDTLKPVSDFTYGLREVIGDTGISIYHDKGKFYNILNLDGTGLHGNGKITYRPTEAESDRFTFHFDSVFAVVRNFKVKEGDYEGVNYPEMFVSKAKYKWLTKKDELIIETIDEPILAHGGRTRFFGTLTISPKGVRASGTLTIEQEQFDSDTIYIDNKDISMINGTYKVSERDEKQNIHFVGTQMNASRNIESGNTNFVSQQSSKPNIRFPNQKYVTSLGQGSFSTENNEIVAQALESRADSNFVQSIDSSQHGLRFPAKIVYYDFKAGDLIVQGIDSINVADATIFPGGNQQIKISKSGKIEDLTEATIVAPRKEKYHKFYDASVQIKNGIYYQAIGKYKYVPINGQDQTIDFYDISVRADTITAARAFVEEDQNFFVTDRFYFKDTVDLLANRKFMTFRGQVKIQSTNPALGESWIKTTLYDANPDSVVVSIKKSSIGNKLIGLVGRGDRQGYYGAFLQNRKHSRDYGILQTEGAVTFDRVSKQFKIGELRRLKNNRYRGNVVSFLESADSSEVITMQGYYDFPDHFRIDDPKQRGYSAEWSGLWRQDNTRQKIKTNLSLKLNLPAALDPALDFYGEILGQTAFPEGDIELNDGFLLESLAEFMAPNDTGETKLKAYKKLIDASASPQAVKFAETLGATITLTGISFHYCDSTFKPNNLQTGSGFFYTDAKNVGWINLNGRTINKYVKAKIVLQIGMRSPLGAYQPDHLFIMLELSEGNTIYFECYNNTVKTTSSNPTYRDRVVAIANKIYKKNKGESNKLDIKLADEKDIFNFETLFGPFQTSMCGR